MRPTFHLKVASREGVLFEGDVASVSSFNNQGEFDILPNHANFISLIDKMLSIRENEKNAVKVLKFTNALMRVKDNNVEVYIGVDSVKGSMPS